jgi:adenine-specific DNA methylase
MTLDHTRDTATIDTTAPVGFTLTDGRQLEFGGQGDRYRKNMAALRLMRQLQAENRPATPDEQWLLAHYSAFGESALLNKAIDDDEEFTALTSQKERHAITEAALTAFYTPQEFLEILWDTLVPVLRAYSGTLHILEPAFGVGMFVATMPMDIRQRSTITAIELDQVSSSIAGYLHPDVNLLKATAFEDAVLEDGTYDLVVSNVPFSGTKVFYPPFAEPYLKRCLHDFFIARSIQLVRPGGLVCVLTSYGTMDKADERTREWIAERADLVAALRLPQGAFASNSGTMCGADLLIFCRK